MLAPPRRARWRARLASGRQPGYLGAGHFQVTFSTDNDLKAKELCKSSVCLLLSSEECRGQALAGNAALKLGVVLGAGVGRGRNQAHWLRRLGPAKHVSSRPCVNRPLGLRESRDLGVDIPLGGVSAFLFILVSLHQAHSSS